MASQATTNFRNAIGIWKMRARPTERTPLAETQHHLLLPLLLLLLLLVDGFSFLCALVWPLYDDDDDGH